MGSIGSDEMAFGPFRLSVRHRTLSDPQGAICLKSRAFDVLVTLIESRAGVVSKDELMRRVWGDLVVEENNLHVQVSAVRRALGHGNRYILTIPGRGYRFVGRLREASAPPDPERLQDDEPLQLTPTTNLPAQMTALVGREADLAAIAGLLDRGRLVTLTGASGVGKTKLAIEAARNRRARFPAGCWWAGLGSVSDPQLALRAVAASLRTDEIRGLSLLDGLTHLLGRGHVLLVLDGCERIAPTVAALVDDLMGRCPGLKVLCTSHARLGVAGERVRRVTPLDVPAPAPAPAAGLRRPRDERSFANPAWEGDVRVLPSEDDARDAPKPRHGVDRPAPAASRTVAASGG